STACRARLNMVSALSFRRDICSTTTGEAGVTHRFGGDIDDISASRVTTTDADRPDFQHVELEVGPVHVLKLPLPVRARQALGRVEPRLDRGSLRALLHPIPVLLLAPLVRRDGFEDHLAVRGQPDPGVGNMNHLFEIDDTGPEQSLDRVPVVGVAAEPVDAGRAGAVGLPADECERIEGEVLVLTDRRIPRIYRVPHEQIVADTDSDT